MGTTMNAVDPTDLLLLDFFNSFFRPLFLRGRSPKTIALYLISIRSFGKYLERAPKLSDLTDDTLNRYLCYYRELPRSPATVNKERANLMAIWRFACRKHFLQVWPDVPKDIQPEPVPLAWLPDEIDRLFRQARKMKGWVGGIPAGEWWTALLSVCWDTGERITAILSLKWTDISLAEGWVVMPAATRKGGRSDEAYRLHGDTIAALSAIRWPVREAVFPWPYHPKYVWQKFAHLLSLAGLPTDRRSKFHRIRRSVASFVKAAGGNPTETMRHRDSRVTRAYLDPRVCGPQQAVDWLFRPGSK